MNGTENPSPAPANPLADAPLFTEDEVLCRTKIADAEQLVAALVRLLADRDSTVDADTAIRTICAREAVSPTTLAPGISMPHARLEGLDRTLVAVATSAQGVRFGSSSDAAHLVILVLTPAHTPAAYLAVVASLARLLRQPAFAEEAIAEKTSTGVAALFRGAHRDPSLPPYVCAADMMAPPLATLRESNSVKDAIDLVLRTGFTDIPVVDKDGELIGVASTQAILGICLPDYILWLEDLSRFTSFEPFETLLAKESSTWLADITDDACAAVTLDRPAIAVAEAMARNKTNVCFVTDADRKLVGVVTLKRFLRNVFRD